MFLYFLSSACDVRYDFCIQTMFGSSLHPVVCRMSYLRDFCLFVYSGVQHILCCVFVLCALCCQFLLIVLFSLHFGNSLTFICRELQSYPFPNKMPSIWIVYILINVLRYCFLIFLTFSLCSIPIDIIRAMVFHATFNNISVLSWWKKPQYSEIATNLSLPKLTTDLSQVTDKLYHIMLHQVHLAMSVFRFQNPSKNIQYSVAFYRSLFVYLYFFMLPLH